MGTRADFYIGRGPEAKWIASIRVSNILTDIGLKKINGKGKN